MRVSFTIIPPLITIVYAMPSTTRLFPRGIDDQPWNTGNQYPSSSSSLPHPYYPRQAPATQSEMTLVPTHDPYPVSGYPPFHKHQGAPISSSTRSDGSFRKERLDPAMLPYRAPQPQGIPGHIPFTKPGIPQQSTSNLHSSYMNLEPPRAPPYNSYMSKPELGPHPSQHLTIPSEQSYASSARNPGLFKLGRSSETPHAHIDPFPFQGAPQSSPQTNVDPFIESEYQDSSSPDRMSKRTSKRRF